MHSGNQISEKNVHDATDRRMEPLHHQPEQKESKKVHGALCQQRCFGMDKSSSQWKLLITQESELELSS